MFFSPSSATTAYTKPLYFATTLTLTIALITTSLILTGCTSGSSPVIQNLYIVSTKYSAASTIVGLGGKVAEMISNDTTPGDFHLRQIKTGYRGICIVGEQQNSTSSAVICSTSTQSLPSVDHDPLDLVNLSELVVDKITFATPIWLALACLVVALVAAIPNLFSLPCIPRPHLVTRKVIAVAAFCGCLLLLGSMVLNRVTVAAIVQLVQRLSMGAVEAKAGIAVPALGWGGFAVAAVAAAASSAAVLAEMAVLAVESRAEKCLERGLDKAGMDPSFLHSINTPSSTPANMSQTFTRQKPAALNLAKSLYRKGMDSHRDGR